MLETREQRHIHDVVAILSLCLVGLVSVGYLLPLFIRSTYRFQIMYNEGWNVYHTQDVQQGRQLYAEPRPYVSVNYPPLSFYVVAAANRFIGDPLFAGRFISALSMFVSAGLLGWIVFVLVHSRTAAILACLLTPVLIARYAPDYIASDDPQFLATAILMVGILFFVANRSTSSLLASGVVIGTALFVKHSIIALPLTLMFTLLGMPRKRLLTWASALCVAVLFWVGFCHMAQGPDLLSNLLLPRAFKNARAAESFMILLNAIQLPFAVAIGWLLVDRASRHRTALAIALALAIGYGLYVSRGDGAWVNHWLDVILVVAVVTSVAWARAEAFWISAAWSRRWILALFPILLTLGVAAQEELPRRIMGLTSHRLEWDAAAASFAADVEYERRHTGPSICEDLSLCAYAGKTLEYEPFSAREEILSNPARAALIIRALTAHEYETVQLNASPEAITGADRALFPAQFMQTLLANYHIDRQTTVHVFFVPDVRNVDH